MNMKDNFWAKIEKPIFALAPMANVTDASFRQIIEKYSRPTGPDVFWTEFVSVEGLLSVGREKLLVDFIYSEKEHPIVAQIFGGKPEQFYEVAKLIVDLDFDGVDINMGCPDRGVEKSGGGAALIKDPKLAQRIILETKRGVADAGSSIPVSVKTRLGYNKNEMETWMPALLETGLPALTVHLRTRKEMSDVPAHWELASQIVEIKNRLAPETVLLGNGDVKDLTHGRQLIANSGVDGVMLGRAIFGNPWLFSEKSPTNEEKLRVCLEHTKLFENLYGVDSVVPATEPEAIRTKSDFVRVISGSRVKPGMTQGKWLKPSDTLTPSASSGREVGRIKPFDVMRKHFKAYVNGFDGAKELRMKMMEAENVEGVENIVQDFLKTL